MQHSQRVRSEKYFPKIIMKIKGEHEDDIHKAREFIKELSHIQDMYYDSLEFEMGLTQRGKDLLFDYVFNYDDEYEDFEHYLERFDLKESVYE